MVLPNATVRKRADALDRVRVPALPIRHQSVNWLRFCAVARAVKRNEAAQNSKAVDTRAQQSGVALGATYTEKWMGAPIQESEMSRKVLCERTGVEVEFHEEELVNEYGTGYGSLYTITGGNTTDFIDLQSALIEEVIGDEYYYGTQRSVWEQVHIDDGRCAPDELIGGICQRQ